MFRERKLYKFLLAGTVAVALSAVAILFTGCPEEPEPWEPQEPFEPVEPVEPEDPIEPEPPELEE